MQTKYVIETVEELVRVFENCREVGDKFPSISGDVKLVYMPMIREFTLTGTESYLWELGEALQKEQGAKSIFQYLCNQSGVPIQWAG